MQKNTSRNSIPNQIAVNNEQKDNPNYRPIHSNHEEPNENTLLHAQNMEEQVKCQRDQHTINTHSCT